MRPANKVVVPFRAVLPRATARRPSRVITAHGGLAGFGAATTTVPVGAGSGAGAAIGASQGASIGSAIVPGIGTAIGAVVGAIGGAIAGAINKTDPENVDFNDAVALWQQNPNAVYSIGNPYLALAGLFDLNITTNIPIYKKFGHMGEAAFVVWLCNTVYQAAQAGKITATDTALTVMSNIVQPAINAWGYGAMSDPHADLINRLIVTMILQYTEGLQGNWLAVGGDYPTQFNSIPPFELPAPAAPAVAAAKPAAPATPAATGAPVTGCATYGIQQGQEPSNVPRPANGTFTNGASITPSSGTYIGDGAGEWYFGANNGNTYGNPIYQFTNSPYYNGMGGVLATVVNDQIYVQTNKGTWFTFNGVVWSPVSAPPPLAEAQTGIPQAPAQPTVIESTDGSQVTAPGTALETPAGTLIYLGPQAPGDPNNQYGYPIWESGKQSGYAVGLLMLNGGQIYCVNNGANGTSGSWYLWTNGAWKILSGPPTLTTASTTSTVASPQATQACTPATTGGGSTATVPVTSAPTTGAVVGTTTSGDAITDSDIQSLIDQMTSQNATASQTYDAVIQALESSGASVTTGLQNQVAAQVQSSAPAAASSGSSDLGLYIVGGGLALLGLLYFMGRRRA